MQRRWPAVLAVAAVLCACGQPVDGVAIAGVPGIAEQFDPCSIPDDAIAATGLDPQIRDIGWGNDVSQKEWTRCVWQSPDEDTRYSFIVLFSVRYTVSDIRLNTSFSDFMNLTFGAREGVQHHYRNYTPLERCGISFDTIDGVAEVSVNNEGPQASAVDPCEVAVRLVTELEKYFPQPA
ncbi:DUF3558 domain-containing protein [Rhodococcus sp. BP22]|uniref:DUF3558 domain-containing protein n=1 Tax=Rhodococcus sp. BP22 TaxID=2758566 RepID=UPI001646D262|nr:DUF3558 domain-containing protein [Rhodococcus sp. BP22]